jgi:signal transduction histidine kinase
VLAFGIVATSATSLRFLYSLFYDQLPRLFTAAVVGGLLASVIFPFTSVQLVHLYALICLLEGLRVVILAVLRKQDGALIIGAGFALFILACIYQLLGLLRVLPLIGDPVYQYGMVAMLATMSLYLARQVAGINGQLQLANAQLTEHSRTLESRVEARTRELSEQNAKLEEVLGELRRTQNQMVLQEKMASLGGLVAGIAHEINTPVGAINSMRDTMSRAHDKLRKAIAGDVTIDATFDIIAEADRVIADGTRRVADLVQSLRTFAHLDEAEYQLVDINEGIDSTLTLLRMQAGGDQIEVVEEFGSLQPLYCAAGRLNQVFMNILKNAFEALGSADGKIVVRTYEDGNDLCVDIVDNGRGIPPEQLERIFNIDLARSAETVKMGFGLSTSYATIEDHGGSIHIDSTVGEGTNVHIRLPRRQQGE